MMSDGWSGKSRGPDKKKRRQRALSTYGHPKTQEALDKRNAALAKGREKRKKNDEARKMARFKDPPPEPVVPEAQLLGVFISDPGRAKAAKFDYVEFAMRGLAMRYRKRPAQLVVCKSTYGLPMSPRERIIHRAITGGVYAYKAGKIQTTDDIEAATMVMVKWMASEEEGFGRSGETLTGKELAIMEVIHAGGQDYPAEGRGTEARQIVLACGRRGGKSTGIVVPMMLYETICRGSRWKKYLPPGQKGFAYCLAQDREGAITILQNNAVAILENSDAFRDWRAGPPTYTGGLQFKNGFAIKTFACTVRSGLGLPCYFLAMDEIARWHLEGKHADKDIYENVSPAMAQFPGAKEALLSTPAAKQGLFWERFKQGYNIEGRVVFQAPTQLMNPEIFHTNPNYISDFKRDQPDGYPRQILAMFAEGVETYFSIPDLERCFVLPGDLPYRPDCIYFLGTDPSGLSGRDVYGMAVSHRESNGDVVVDATRAIETRKPRDIADNLKDLRDTYKIGQALGDRYGAGWTRSQLEEAGLEVIDAVPLPSLYSNAKTLVNGEHWILPDNGDLRAGLVNTKAYYGKNQALSIDHERGASGHADRADAVVRASWLASRGFDRGPNVWNTGESAFEGPEFDDYDGDEGY